MKKLIIVLLIGVLFTTCDDNQTTDKKESESPEKIKVFAVNYPLLYFAERIGGDKVDLIYPIPADEDPAYWVPYQAIEEIQNADLILDNGANYAKWMEKVSLPASKVINTTEAFQDKYIKIQQGETHSHGGGGEHVHYGYAFTTWLDFKIAAGQAFTVMEALSKKLPEFKNQFQSNYDSLYAELVEFDKQMLTIGKALEGKTLFASHPVYQYLERAYELNIISMHWEPGEFPAEKQWKSFLHDLEHHPSDIMLWEAEPGEEIREKLIETGINVIIFNPCGNKPANTDFIQQMQFNIDGLDETIHGYTSN